MGAPLWMGGQYEVAGTIYDACGTSDTLKSNKNDLNNQNLVQYSTSWATPLLRMTPSHEGAQSQYGATVQKEPF